MALSGTRPSAGAVLSEVGDVEPALSKEILDISIAEREAQIEPDGMLDDNRRKSVTAVGDPDNPASLLASSLPGYPVILTRPGRQVAGLSNRWTSRPEGRYRFAGITAGDYSISGVKGGSRWRRLRSQSGLGSASLQILPLHLSQLLRPLRRLQRCLLPRYLGPGSAAENRLDEASSSASLTDGPYSDLAKIALE
jgi:hypothetical protein